MKNEKQGAFFFFVHEFFFFLFFFLCNAYIKYIVFEYDKASRVLEYFLCVYTLMIISGTMRANAWLQYNIWWKKKRSLNKKEGEELVKDHWRCKYFFFFSHCILQFVCFAHLTLNWIRKNYVFSLRLTIN